MSTSNKQTKKSLKGSSFQMPHPSSICSLDCEMVGVGQYGATSSVARVTVVDWSGDTLLDSYVIQKQPVTDYRTFVSGITKEDLDSAVLTLDQCRDLVSSLLYNRILVGHALKNDLEALGISHPWWLTRDTATYLPFMKKRPHNTAWWPRKLKELAMEKLDREIQVYGIPHSPIEDAKAALDLYKTVQEKWEGEIYDSVLETKKSRQQKYGAEQYAQMQYQHAVYAQFKYNRYLQSNYKPRYSRYHTHQTQRQQLVQ